MRVAITECIERYNESLPEGLPPMTQARLASEIGVTQGAVSRWALGNRPVRVDTLAKIARVLHCGTEDLLKQG